MPTFDHGGATSYFVVLDGENSRRPRMFVNGSGSTVDDVLPILGTFAQGAPLAVLDHRGMGKSSMPPSVPSMAEYAADVVALAEHLAWDAFDLIGVSFGGMVAQEVAIHHPERVSRLVLACTSSGGAGGSSYPLHDVMDLSETDRRRVLPRLQDSRFDEEWLATHEGLVERMVVAPRTRPNSEGYVMQMEARRRHDTWDRLTAIQSPTFIASGVFDGIAPAANGRRMATRITGSRFQEYQGGHMFFLQDQSFFLDLADFLSEPDDDCGGV